MHPGTDEQFDGLTVVRSRDGWVGRDRLGDHPQEGVTLALPPAVVLGEVDRQRLLVKLLATGRLARPQVAAGETRERARLTDPDTQLAVQRQARLQVRAAPLGLTGNKLGQALKPARPRLEHRFSDLLAQLACLGQDASRGRQISHRDCQLARRDLRLHPVPITRRAPLEQQLRQAKALSLPKLVEQIARSGEHRQPRTGLRRGRPLHRRADVLIVIVQLIDEPLPPRLKPLLRQTSATAAK